MAAEPRLERDAEAGLLRWCNAGLEASVLYVLLAAWARPREGSTALLPVLACLAIPGALALRQALALTTVSAVVRQAAVVVSALAWALTAARLVAPTGYWQEDAPRALLVMGAMFGGPVPAGHQPLAFWTSLLLWWRGYVLLEWLPSVDDALGDRRAHV